MSKALTTPLIFLDVDGVLNTHDYDAYAKSNPIHRDKVELLNHIIFETNAKIVLSSAWRYLVHRQEMTITGLNWLFRSHGLVAHAIVDITSEDIPGPGMRQIYNERAYQVEKYLIDNNPNVNYVIIDDNDFDFTIRQLNFVQTQVETGLTKTDVEQAISFLKHGKPFQ